MIRSVFAVLLMGALCACSSFRRSSGSGYAGQSGTRPALSGAENSRIASELGYSPHEDLSADQMEAIDKRRRLRQLEARLESKREKEQYSKILPWLESDDEKIEFLSMSGLEGRQAWINSRGIWRRAQGPDDTAKTIIDAGDIAVGMAMDHVRRSWGEPQSVEVSGNPIYKNERWKYVRFQSSPDGYRQEKRFVYFEGGRVVGWETE